MSTTTLAPKAKTTKATATVKTKTVKTAEKKNANFVISYGKNFVSFHNQGSDAKLKISWDKNNEPFRETTEMEAKEYQYALNISKFIVSMVQSELTGTLSEKIKNIADHAKQLAGANNFRHMSNRIRQIYKQEGVIKGLKEGSLKYFDETESKLLAELKAQGKAPKK